MTKEELKKLADNEKYVPGIYNYCDRWCERCSYTSKCLNYAMSEEHFGDTEKLDENNKEFWEKISKIFQLTYELIEDEAKRLNIDLAEIKEEETGRELIKEKLEGDELVIKSKNYARKVSEWFEGSKDLFETKEEELNNRVELDLPEDSPFDDIYEINDIAEVIRWYQFQISVKLQRALSGKFDEFSLEEDEIQNDANGSTKVALIGIDRSIAAWGKMLKQFPEREDDILHFLILLKELRQKVEKEFPNARRFVRIGFD